MRFFWIVFVLLPIAEIFVFIKVGQQIGAWATIGLVLLSSAVGLALLRQQGYAAILRARQKMEQGTLPAREMVDGIFLSLAGGLLLLPGFITDVLGFCCLIPGLRRAVVGWGFARMVVKKPMSQSNSSASDGKVIEGDFTRDD